MVKGASMRPHVGRPVHRSRPSGLSDAPFEHHQRREIEGWDGRSYAPQPLLPWTVGAARPSLAGALPAQDDQRHCPKGQIASAGPGGLKEPPAWPIRRCTGGPGAGIDAPTAAR